MAHAPELKREARRRYVIERQSLPTIEAALNVNQRTLSRWKAEALTAGDDWEQFRKAHAIAGEGLESVLAATVEDFVMFAQMTVTGLKDQEGIEASEKIALLAKLADATGKMVASAGRLAPRLSELGIAQDVLSRLATWIGDNHPTEGTTLVEILPEFAAKLAEAYGK